MDGSLLFIVAITALVAWLNYASRAMDKAGGTEHVRSDRPSSR